VKPDAPLVLAALMRMLGSNASKGLEGDLIEGFNQTLTRTGDLDAARRAYRREALISLLPMVRMRLRELNATALLGGVVGAATVLGWFVGMYALLAATSGPGGKPLGDLPPTVFLALWVLGSAGTGGLAAGRFRPATAKASGLLAGWFACMLVLAGADVRPAFSEQLVVVLIALTGAVAGAAAGARSVRKVGT